MKSLKNILFLDIETISAEGSYDAIPERLKPLWDSKAKYIVPPEVPSNQAYFDKAAIYAEFGKIIVIGIGFFFQGENEGLSFKVKAIYGKDELALLLELKELLQTKFNGPSFRLCAHNGKEFDYPYICRRMIIHDIELPHILKISDKKPWDVPHLDTLDMWKFGDKKSYTSLELLAAVLGVPTSKDGIDGSKVNQVYYNESGLERIADYCKKDVIVTAQIYLRLTGNKIMEDQNIIVL